MIRLNENDRRWIEDNTEHDDSANALIHYIEHNFERRIKFAKMKAKAKALLDAIDTETIDEQVCITDIRSECIMLRNAIRRDRESDNDDDFEELE